MLKSNIKKKLLSMNKSQIILILAISMVTVTCLMIYLQQSLISVSYPFQLEYGEGFILDSAVLFSQGQSIYPPVTENSPKIALYPPVYYCIYSIFINLFGISFAWGRIISVLSAIIIGFLIFLIINKKTANIKISVICLVIFLMSPAVYKWSSLARVDLLALLFSFIGVYLIFRYKTDKIYLSAVFFTLSIFTKQSYFIAPIATFLYLFLKNQRRIAVKFLAFFVVLVFLVFFLFNSTSGGQFYIQTIKYNSVHEFSMERAINFIHLFVEQNPIITFLSLSFLIGNVIKRKISFLEIYFILSILSLFLAGKIGSTNLYHLEAIAVACILSGFYIGRISREDNTTILVVILVAYFLVIPILQNDTYEIKNWDLEVDRKMSVIIQNSRGRILSENAGLLVLNNRSEDVFEFFVFTQLSKAEIWNQSCFINDIKNKEFKLIILYSNNKNRFTKEIMNATGENYVLWGKIGSKESRYNYYCYIPKG